jgi:hypothetical protein
MKKPNLKLAAGLGANLCAALTLLVLTGCDDTVAPWDLQLTARSDASIRIDVVAFNLNTKQEWLALNQDEYWAANNAVRASANRLTFKMVGRKFTLEEAKVRGADLPNAKQGLTEGASTLTIPRGHPIWQKWLDNKAVGLAIITQIPAAKKIAPLWGKCWKTNERTLQFEVQDGRIEVITLQSEKAIAIAAKNGIQI